jgi:DNA-binding transcriptional ArsR family regulator
LAVRTCAERKVSWYYSGRVLVEEPLSGQVTTPAQEPATEQLDLPTVLAALADPGRLAIVRALADQGEECCNKVGELAGLTVGKSTLSHHMKVLRESGVTRTRAQGTHRYVSLRRAELDEAFPQLLDAVLGQAVPLESR